MKREMKMKLAWLAAAAILGGGATAEAAETPVYTLDDIVVTASRVPEKAIDANADVTVVTAEEMEAHHYKDVAEAVRHVPGVTVSNHTGNSQVGMSDRILMNGSANVVVLVNGMRMNTNGNVLSGADFGTLSNMAAIERIEVLKGSASTLYGSDAQGGVINIITKKAEDGMKTKLGVSFGSYDGEKYSLYHQGAQDGFFWSVNAEKQLSGDYKDGWGRKAVSHLNAKTYGIELGKELGNDSDIRFAYQKYKADYTRPENGTNTYDPAYGKKDNERISLQYNAKVSDHLRNVFSVYRNTTHITDYYNASSAWSSMDMKMKTTGFSDQLIYTVKDQTITGGIDWYKDEIPFFANNPDIEGTHATNTAFYIQDKWDITERWNVTPGIRVDHHSMYGTHTLPSLVVGYKASEKTNLYASYKEFFNAPNLYQLYSPYGDKGLDPEEGWTIEIGAAHEFDATLKGSLSVYRQHAKNLIGYDYATYHYANMGKTDQTGVNASLTKTFGEHWSASLGYTYINADIANSVYTSLPKHKLDIGVGYTDGALTANLTGCGVMDRYAKGVMKDYDSYWVWDLAASYKFRDAATVYARVNNIFDQFYTEVGSAGNDPFGTWYSAPGRNYEVGVSFEF